MNSCPWYCMGMTQNLANDMEIFKIYNDEIQNMCMKMHILLNMCMSVWNNQENVYYILICMYNVNNFHYVIAYIHIYVIIYYNL